MGKATGRFFLLEKSSFFYLYLLDEQQTEGPETETMLNYMAGQADIFELRASAHRLGTEYHRQLTHLKFSGRQDREECERLAGIFLISLLDLEDHLSTLRPSSNVMGLRISNKKHIDLVRKDLELLQALTKVNAKTQRLSQ